MLKAIREFFFGPPAPPPKVHDYTRRGWGHNYTIMQVIDGGQALRAGGWGAGISPGDYLLLQEGKNSSTRYQVETIQYMRDPRDQWFATLVFAPRTEEEKEVDEAITKDHHRHLC